jgi:hypothetical protein
VADVTVVAIVTERVLVEEGASSLLPALPAAEIKLMERLTQVR